MNTENAPEPFGIEPSPGIDESNESEDRRYICTSCDSIVRARWHGTGSFAVGCDCQTVPVVPQMTQYDTPDQWRVQRPECCREADSSDLETVYGGDGDYQCPDCEARYTWDGEMVSGPVVADG